MGTNHSQIKHTKQTIAIVAGGKLAEIFLADINNHDIIIGADRGAWWLLSHKIIPHYAIGDFDSVSPEELTIIKETSPNVVQYNIEKDETDLELALQLAVKMLPKSIKIFGSIGSRLDHSLAGIFLLETYETDITVIDESNELSVIRREKTIFRKKNLPYCSFISLTDNSEISLDGFKYPLNHGMLMRHKTLGISNEVLKKSATITVHSGRVLCIQSRG